MDEKLLIHEIKEGNKEAFNALVQPYMQKAYRASYLILHDRSLAEDAVQESLIQAYKSMHRFDEKIASFKTWFHQILIHMTLKQKRKKRLAFLQIETWFQMKEVKTPESDFLIKEETRMVMQAVKYLPIKEQVVIVLFYYQDLSILEIAQVLHIKEGTVKSRLYKARENLRGYLSYCIMEDHEKEMNAWIE